MFRAVPSLLYGRQRAIGVNMTGTRAVTEFADGVSHVRIFVLLMWPRFVLVRVTRRTIRLERGVAVLNLFRIRLMAICTGQVVAMVLRFIRQRRVPIICRRPGICDVALITLVISVEVSLVLANRLHAVVAGRTGSKHLRMVNRHDRCKHIGRMTVFAHIGGLHVRRILARCIRAVMAS